MALDDMSVDIDQEFRQKLADFTRRVAKETVEVRESADRVDVDLGGEQISPGDQVVFSASGQIWAGVWLTGHNGPHG